MAIKEVKNIPIKEIKFNPKNPRFFGQSLETSATSSPIFISPDDENEIPQDKCQLLLSFMIDADKMQSSTSDFAQLQASIKAKKGIINPIHALELPKPEGEYKYIVSEGNTRLAIYKDLNSQNNPEPWTNKIICCVLENEDDFEDVMAIAHIVGVKEWPPYSRAKKLAYIKKKDSVQYEQILAKCGSSAARGSLELRINAFNHMERVKKFFDQNHEECIEGPKPFTPQLFAFFEEYNKYKSKFEPEFDDIEFAKAVRTGKLVNARQVAPLARMFEKPSYRKRFLSKQFQKDATPLIQEFINERKQDKDKSPSIKRKLLEELQAFAAALQPYYDEDTLRAQSNDFHEIQLLIKEISGELEALTNAIDSHIHEE